MIGECLRRPRTHHTIVAQEGNKACTVVAPAIKMFHMNPPSVMEANTVCWNTELGNLPSTTACAGAGVHAVCVLVLRSRKGTRAFCQVGQAVAWPPGEGRHLLQVQLIALVVVNAINDACMHAPG